MFYVIILFILLALITIINYVIQDGIYISPAVIFSIAFTFSSFWLIFFVEKWNIELHLNTILVIIFGVLIFSIISKIVSESYKHLNKRQNYKEPQELPLYDINRKKLYIFLAFCVFTLLITLYYNVKSVGGSLSNISASLYKFRNLSAYNNVNLKIPIWIEIFSGILHAGSYWFIYIFINNLVKIKKIDWTILTIAIICTMSTLLEGSRGGIINIILAIVPITYLIINKNNGYKSKIKLKSVIVIMLIAIILITTLKETATLLGRNDIAKMNPIDYIAMYAGSQIKNLDSFLQEKQESETLVGIHTFLAIYKIFGYNSSDFEIKQSFRYVNGISLGNVYTIFFEFICDLGYLGVFVFTSFMAIFCQIMFEKNKSVRFNKKTPPMSIIIYSYMFGGIVFSFFGNKFFSQIFSLGFLKYLILWYMLNYFFCKLKIKVNK